MRTLEWGVGLCALVGVVSIGLAEDKPASSVLSFKAKDIDGKEVDLSEFKGKVLLIVNVASL